MQSPRHEAMIAVATLTGTSLESQVSSWLER